MSEPMVILPECPHCHKHDVAFYYSSCRYLPNSNNIVVFYTCGNCFKGLCAHAYCTYKENIERLSFTDFHEVYPQPLSNTAPEFTPDNVAKRFIEAQSSFKHGNIEASCMMARSSIETAIVDKGGSGNNLSQDIKKLAASHVITQAMADWADEVRVIGNDAAHSATRDTPPTKEDAKDAISFAEMLFTYLYTLPNQIAERRIRKTEETG